MPARTLKSFFDSRGWQPFPFQEETWNAYLEGKSGLLHAPTGLGKTLAVYLGPLAESIASPTSGCQILWITPLRALAADTLRALREPLSELAPRFTAEARTGDTPAALRARLRNKLPHTFVTTPESLSLMLTHGDTREKLANLRCVIVDEWHELLGTKRGVQTELCLARLRAWLPHLRTWGLSATLGNLTEARDTLIPPRSVEISSTSSPPPPSDLPLPTAHPPPCTSSPQPSSSLPLPTYHPAPNTSPSSSPLITDHSALGTSSPLTVSADLRKDIVIETVIPKEIDHFPWAGHIGTRLAPQVVRHIEMAATTLLFTNTRSQTEIWFQEILQLKPEWKDRLAMHHGSLDRAERDLAEQGLRDGSLKCVVCTSSLDLGVDFSPVDQVIQVGSPKGIARLLQRAGRSGHQPGKTSRILCVPSNALELVEFAAARDAAQARHIESRPPLRKPLDLLVQHLVTCAIGESFLPEEMRREIRSTHAFADLTDDEWQWSLGFISNGGKALAAYPRYQKARIEGGRYTVDDKRLILQHRLSIGTISADPAVVIKFANGHALGTVEESFISRIKPGGNLIFSGRHLTLVRFHNRTATVKPAGKTAKGQIAIWGGARMPLSTELSHAIALRLKEGSTGILPVSSAKTPKSSSPPLSATSAPPRFATSKISKTPSSPPLLTSHSALGTSSLPFSPEMEAIQPILDIQRRWSRLPSDDSLLVEFTRSKEGEHLFLFPFAGRLVHEGLGTLVAYRIGRETHQSIQATQNDYGFSLTASRGLVLDEKTLRRHLSPEHLLDDLIASMNTAELARRNFREIARISGLILQQPPGRRDRSRRELQSSSTLLYEVLQRYDSDNLLLRQSEREILEKQLEFTRLHQIIENLTTRPFHLVETDHLTPMAFPLWADRLQSVLVAADAATRLADMLEELNAAASGQPPPPRKAEDPAPKRNPRTDSHTKPLRRRHGF